MELISPDEARARGLKRYFTGEVCKNGHVAERMLSNWRCIECLKKNRLVYLRRRRRERPGSMSEIDRRAHQRHKDYKVEWARGPGKLSKQLDKQRRRAGPAMPPWADQDEIKRIYAERPDGMVVDHIVPLKHFTEEGYPVSGLHVPWNLQYIPQSKNAAKTPRDRYGWLPGY